MSLLPPSGEPPGTVTTLRLSPCAHPAVMPIVAATRTMTAAWRRADPRTSVRIAVRLLASEPGSEEHGGTHHVRQPGDRPHHDSGHLLIGQRRRHAVVRIGREPRPGR